MNNQYSIPQWLEQKSLEFLSSPIGSTQFLQIPFYSHIANHRFYYHIFPFYSEGKSDSSS
jgi:hypothetical protein